MASPEKVILILQNTYLSSTPNIIIVVFVDALFADLKACNFLYFPPSDYKKFFWNGNTHEEQVPLCQLKAYNL